jgi:hypothetical protein
MVPSPETKRNFGVGRGRDVFPKQIFMAERRVAVEAPRILYSAKPSATRQDSLMCCLIRQALWRLPAAQAALM